MNSSDDFYDPMFYGADAARIFSSHAQLAHMVAFEISLGHSLEECGLAPAGTGAGIENACPLPAPGESVSWLDSCAISQEAVPSGNLAIPFVKHLTAHVQSQDAAASAFVHLGATSQDLLDTALVIQLSDATSLLDTKLVRLIDVLRQLVATHRDTVLAGRTWMQQGPPVTMGLKCAGWLSAMARDRERLAASRSRALVLQFGGAVGTLASLGSRGDAVASALARRLNLSNPILPWHTQRDNLSELAAAFAIHAGNLGKIARDVSLLMQTEVSEAFEAAGQSKGGSSTMPHKRNPVACAYILSAAMRTPALLSTLLTGMVQEHERGLGGWHAEWQTLPELCRLTLGALDHGISLLEGLEVSPDRMAANFAATRGYALGESIVARLAPSMGRLSAHHLVEDITRKALAQDKPLLDVLLASSEIRRALSEDEIRASLVPQIYLGMTTNFIDRVLGYFDKEGDDALR